MSSCSTFIHAHAPVDQLVFMDWSTVNVLQIYIVDLFKFALIICIYLISLFFSVEIIVWIHEFSSDIHFLPLISLCSFHVYILLSEIQLHPLTKVHSVKCLRQDGTVWQLYKESQSEETTFSCIGLISRKYYAYWAKNSWLDTVAMIFLVSCRMRTRDWIRNVQNLYQTCEKLDIKWSQR